MIRKNISLDEKDYEIISNYAMHCGTSFSELLRRVTLQFISMQEEMDLVTFLNNHLDYVSDEEQAEIDMLGIDFNDLSGKELTINDFL